MLIRLGLTFVLMGASLGCGQGEVGSGDAASGNDDAGESGTDAGVDMGAPVVLAPPADLAAFSPFGQRVVLSWQDASTGEDGYEVARSCTSDAADAEGFCTIASLPADADAYTDNHSKSDLTYMYRVRVVSGGDSQEAATEIHTPPLMETAIAPRPQGVWRLGEQMTLAGAVNVTTNVAPESLGILLRATSDHSLLSRLAAAGVTVTQDTATDPAAGEVELLLHQFDGGAPQDISPGLVTFEEIGEEGSVILVEPAGEGTRMIVASPTPAGIYRGGMAALQLLVGADLSAAATELTHQIILDYPDHPTRSFYEPLDATLTEDATLTAAALDMIDARARSGANLYFQSGFAYVPMKEISWNTWEDNLAQLDAIQTAAADRFMDVVMEAGGTGGSASQWPEAYAFVDGLAIHDEPFILTQVNPNVWEAQPVSPLTQLVPDSDMDDPSAWVLPTAPECQYWSYDAQGGHDTPGSWRIDAEGAGNCSQLRIWLDPSTIVDGRYLLTARVRSAEPGEHLGPYTGPNAQVTTVVKYDDGTFLQLNERSIGIGGDISTLTPSKSNHDGSDWFELYNTFVIELKGRTVEEVYLYARASSGQGTFWLDELSLERIDGSLRNVAGGVAPIIATSSDGATTYVEGTHFEVCQVGLDSGTPTEICTSPGSDANYETVFWINSWAGTLQYGLEPRYSQDLTPFVIRWMDGVPRPTDDIINVTYDINLPYMGQYGLSGLDYVGQRLNYCAIEEIFNQTAWGDAYDKVLGTGALQLGASSLRIDLSEVRGVNRSYRCHELAEVDGEWTWRTSMSNGARFAQVANHLIAEAKQRNPAVVAYFWDDMFNPTTNGGSLTYQQSRGGVEGASACALSSQAPAKICGGVDDVVPIDPDAVMIQWGYKPQGIRNTAATAAYYDAIDRPWLIGPGGDHLVAEDWASIANASTSNVGVSSFFFYEHDVPRSLRTFWNHDWKLAYILDFETDATSLIQTEAPAFSVVSGGGTVSTDGTCASNGSGTSNNWAGSSDGGLCVDETSALTGRVAQRAATAGHRYKVGVHVAWAAGAVIEPPRARLIWTLSDGGEQAGAWVDTAEVVALPDGFVRYGWEGEGVSAPEDSVGVSVEWSFAPGVAALDNLFLWESMPLCFDECAGG